MRLALANTVVRMHTVNQVWLVCKYRFGHQVRWVKNFDPGELLHAHSRVINGAGPGISDLEDSRDEYLREW
jgi:hypothetical protein